MRLDHLPEIIDGQKYRKILRKLAAKYSRKLLKNYRSLDSGDQEAAHDLRVTTRRLQAVLEVVSSEKSGRKARKLRSRLKRLRHAIGEERDLEITLGRARQRSRRAASSNRRRLWKQIENDTHDELDRSIRRARQKLERIQPHDLRRRIERVVQKSLKPVDAQPLCDGVARARDKLSSCLGAALTSDDSSHYHDVRIKAKSLRYILELLSELSVSEPNSHIVELLKSVQDELGDWHDETELCRRATAILSKTPDSQADEIATSLLDSLRNQMRDANHHAREIISSLAAELRGAKVSRNSSKPARKQRRGSKS